MLAALSEAHEDHMRQLLVSSMDATNTRSTQSITTRSAVDPWRPHNTSTTVAEEEDDILEGYIETNQHQYPKRWRRWLCCCDQHATYTRAVVERTSNTTDYSLTNPTFEQENASLLDCDELQLTWENQDR